MIEAIEEEARKPDTLPADIFKLIERCLTSLSQKAKRQGLSDEVIKQREPTREGQFTSNLRPRWTIPVTARRVPSK